MARRVYAEAGGGVNVADAIGVVVHSRALPKAVARGDRVATRHALERLVVGHIGRIRVLRDGRVLSDIGRRMVVAPVRGSIVGHGGRRVGSFELGVVPVGSYTSLVQHLTGAAVRVQRTSSAVSASQHGSTAQFPATGLPSGPLRVVVRVPRRLLPGRECRDPRAAAAEEIGRVGVRIYRGEVSGTPVKAALRVIRGSHPLVVAVAHTNRRAARAAIVRLLSNHMHIVRIRALRARQVIADVGGPLILGPVRESLRDARRRRVGSVVTAIQDDVGYVLLVRRFTGAVALLRAGDRQVMGALRPGPVAIPDRGPIDYRGVRYYAFSFLAEAFPSGTLRISLLIRASSL